MSTPQLRSVSAHRADEGRRQPELCHRRCQVGRGTPGVALVEGHAVLVDADLGQVYEDFAHGDEVVEGEGRGNGLLHGGTFLAVGGTA